MTPDTKFWVAEGKSRKSTKWRNRELTWTQFVDKLRTPRRTPETMRQYKAMSKDERDTLKEMPGGFVGGRLSGPRRLVSNVAERWLITLDADYATERDWKNFTLLYDDLACVAYPTHSSTPEAPRLRWVLPVSRPLTPEEYPAVARRVAEWIGIETMDTSTYDLNRLFYYPGVPDDAPYELKEQHGRPVDVDEVLRSYGPEEAWKDCSLWPAGSKELEVRRTQITKAGAPTEKPGVVGLFCRTYDVPGAIAEFLPDVYEETSTPGRYTYAAGSTAGGAIVYNDGAFLYSNHGTDPAAGRSVNAFDLVRIHKFGNLDTNEEQGVPVTKLKSYEAMCQFALELPDVRRQMADEKQAEADAVFGDMTADPVNPVNNVTPGGNDAVKAGDDQDNDWVRLLTVKPKSSEVENTIDNARLILANDKRLKGRVCYNEFTMRRCAEDPLPWTPGRTGLRCWEDNDDAGLRCYMEKVWGISNRAVVADAEALAAMDNKRHPVREYLSGLVWDGIPRAETVLIDYMGAEDTPLNREIAKRWLVAAVARVFQPGRKFDTILVLVSPEQGIGKSQFADILGGEYFQDGLPAIGSKDAMQTLRGAWIVEVSEMAATKKADDEAIKVFFACRSDRYRESYGRYEAEHPRQCVFVGSTNTREFITDNTGGRRFWPVDVGGARASTANVGARMDGLRAVRDQVWAEAMVLYKAGKTPLWFSERHFIDELTAQQTRHTQEDEWIGWVHAFLDKPLPDNWDELSMDERRACMQEDDLRFPAEVRAKWTRRRMEVTIAELRNELLREDLAKGAGGANQSSRHLGRVMNVLPGWKLTTRQTAPSFPFGRQKLYVRAPGRGSEAWSE